jgi:[ribosomal protein S5]-alanine N-acetyltransferase
MDIPMVLATSRLTLRDLRAADAPSAFANYAGDPAVTHYLGWRTHADVSETARQIGLDVHRRLKGSALVWGLVSQGDAQVIGQIEALPMSHPSEHAHHWRLGYVLGRAHWGQGLMPEALAAVVAALWQHSAIWRVDALCDVDNLASSRVLVKAGFVREGCLQRALMHPQVSEHPRDAWLFAALRSQLDGALLKAAL